jgi:hypothetical protein
VLAERKHYLHLGGEKQRLQYLIDYCHDHKQSNHHLRYELHNERVCKRAFLAILGCSADKLAHARQLDKQGQNAPESHPDVCAREAAKFNSVAGWLQWYIKERCDPSSNANGIVYLPSSVNWTALYKEFREDFSAAATISKSTFEKVRLDDFAFLHKKKADDFAHCDICIDLHDAFTAAQGTAGEDAAKAALDAHHKSVKTEEKLLEFCKQEAAHGKVMHLYVDYSKSIALPYHNQKPEVHFIRNALVNMFTEPESTDRPRICPSWHS